MKRYALRKLSHDAKIFSQLRWEYRNAGKNQSTDSVAVPRLRCDEATRTSLIDEALKCRGQLTLTLLRRP